MGIVCKVEEPVDEVVEAAVEEVLLKVFPVVFIEYRFVPDELPVVKCPVKALLLPVVVDAGAVESNE